MTTVLQIDAQLTPIISELVTNGITLDQAMTAFEAKYIDAAVQQCGTITKAARQLGVHRNTLHNKRRGAKW